MTNYICNPININYRYQFIKNPIDGSININREAADPSMILFKGKYYIFSSMSLDVQVSVDLVHWESKRLPDTLPLYGYAPDATVCGDFVYFCANESDTICHFYRTQDILDGPYEMIEGTFPFLDPHLFVDDDGRMYFYWGLSCKAPIYGVELDPETMRPIDDRKELIWGEPFEKGFERIGEDNSTLPCSEEELQKRYKEILKKQGIPDESKVPPEMADLMKDILRDAPYIEGAWMNKLNGKYYLQYAAPGTHYNVYGDGVYVSDHPLGEFVLADNNPYSYKPGGFIPGAGHGSTLEDLNGNLWHASTMRISVNHQFERRIGIWPAGIDSEGELFCNQRYGDWPLRIDQNLSDAWNDPEWYLLSYGKKVLASSFAEENSPNNAVDENIQTWWRANSSKSGEWIEIDLNGQYDVHAIQINFADDNIELNDAATKIPAEKDRYIAEEKIYTRWILEGSLDQEKYFLIEDKSAVETDLAHDFIVEQQGITMRFLRLTILEIPYGQKACVSGLRVFGRGNGMKPEKPEFEVHRMNELDMEVEVNGADALGYNILWGHNPEKLYHSCMVFESSKRIGALVKNQEYYVRVDAFNESGITTGDLRKVGRKKI